MRPVTLDELDADEALLGYMDARNNWPCGDNRSPSYRRGWQNAINDNLRVTDEEQRRLAAEFIAKQRASNEPA